MKMSENIQNIENNKNSKLVSDESPTKNNENAISNQNNISTDIGCFLNPFQTPNQPSQITKFVCEETPKKQRKKYSNDDSPIFPNQFPKSEGNGIIFSSNIKPSLGSIDELDEHPEQIEDNKSPFNNSKSDLQKYYESKSAICK
mgnify:CR=1 FL=1